jgi:hypothetical protein
MTPWPAFGSGPGSLRRATGDGRTASVGADRIRELIRSAHKLGGYGTSSRT